MAMIAMTTSNSMRVNAEKRTGMLFTEGNEDNEGGCRQSPSGVRPKTRVELSFFVPFVASVSIHLAFSFFVCPFVLPPVRAGAQKAIPSVFLSGT